VAACPVGSLQAVAASSTFQFSFYVAGFLGMAGITLGRFICGWICPFGLIQDLFYRIPSPKFLLPAWMRYIKYIMLFIPVLILPALLTDAFGLGVPYFCKWLCPAGTLEAAIPLYFSYEPIRPVLGKLFAWRLFWLFLVLIFIILIRRVFCQAFCPLGALYSFFNRYSIYSLNVDRNSCTGCNTCQRACFAGIPVSGQPNHPECIRCLDCIKSCPNRAISWHFGSIKKVEGDEYSCPS
jgi:polyferredoxin